MPAQAPAESGEETGGESAASSASLEAAPSTVSLEEQPVEAPADQPPAAREAAQEDGALVEQEAVEDGQEIAGSAAPADAAQAAGELVMRENPEGEAAHAPEPALAMDAPHKITLAEVDREAAEEEALREPDWHLGHLRELADVLAKMTGEATQQERNARTLTYKLRAMLQGMPTTRRVDVMADRLRSALEAIAKSANQVHQASKTLPASAFQASRKSSDEG
jgi:hypothetical protein